ncbi:hypothetical protein EVAR_75706_1 [Eumeta japonica]|uniref:Uncharacterized protein n=1 Tax=Eumeta variegata TaxID=151549 RepID=A0A4C1W434_EUMVA|nr:hypothetical protein EVAR_75706_1 [Eumeta japonica]
MEKAEQDRQISSYDLAEELAMDQKTILVHLNKAGHTKKLDNWVQHELTERNLMNRVLICDSLSKLFPVLTERRPTTSPEPAVTIEEDDGEYIETSSASPADSENFTIWTPEMGPSPLDPSMSYLATTGLHSSPHTKAKEAITHLFIANAEPSEIIRVLETRFEQPDSIALLANLDRLRNILRPTDSPRDICLFANSTKNCVATLQVRDRIHYLYNPEIVKNLVDKLTPTQRYRLFDCASEQTTEEPDLWKLDKFIEKEAERRGRFAPPKLIASADFFFFKRTVRNRENDPELKKNNEKKKTLAPIHYCLPTIRVQPLEAEYMKRAEKLWVRASQQESLNSEIAAVTQRALPGDSHLRHSPYILMNAMYSE